MAKTFGPGKGKGGSGGGDDKKDDKKSVQKEPEPEGACGGGEDSGDGTQSRSLEEREIEDAEEGHFLFVDFIQTEIQRSGLTLSDQPSLSPFEDYHLNHDRLINWTRAGRELRMIADTFSKSKERKIVLSRAQEINLESLDFDNFLKMLQELFQGEGVTRERILVLFFFCADLAIEAIKKGFTKTFNQMMRWALQFIMTKVSSFVSANGGWGVVLRSSLSIAYQVTSCLAFIAIVAACTVYIRRNLN